MRTPSMLIAVAAAAAPAPAPAQAPAPASAIVLVDVDAGGVSRSARKLVERELAAALAARSSRPLPGESDVKGALELAGLRRAKRPDDYRAVARALGANLAVRAEVGKEGNDLLVDLWAYPPGTGVVYTASRAFPAIAMREHLPRVVDDLLRQAGAAPAAPPAPAPAPAPGGGVAPVPVPVPLPGVGLPGAGGLAPEPSPFAPAAPSQGTPAGAPAPAAPPSDAFAAPPSGTAAEPAAPAPAEPATVPSPEAMAEARRHFQQGVVLFEEGNCEGALSEFERSHELNPVPAVLFNVGLTQKCLYRYGEAIASLQRFLAEAPTARRAQRQEAQQIIDDMRLLLAEVTVEVDPEGAEVIADGRPAGAAPLAGPLLLATGEHVVEVRKQGFRTAELKLNVAAGVPQRHRVALEEIPTEGVASIETAPPGVEAVIDGEARGRTPLRLRLREGAYTLQLREPGFRPYQGELTIAAGKTRQVAITMEKEQAPRRWYQSGWVLGGAAVLAAAGGVGAYLLLTAEPEEPVDGTLPPGVQTVP